MTIQGRLKEMLKTVAVALGDHFLRDWSLWAAAQQLSI